MSAQQNLVPNGSFEDTVHCPGAGADIYNALYFSSPTNGTPDYFNVCANIIGGYGIPSNGLGYQMAHTGNAYGGFVCYGFGSDYREYIQTPLISTLERNKVYYVEYYVSLGNFSPVSNNNFGALFTENNEFFNIYTIIQNSESLNYDKIISDSLNWSKVSFYYTAKGNENNLIIGNFYNDINTDTVYNMGGISDNYYFIDDISVIKIDYQIPNIFTPNDDSSNDLFYFNTEIINPINLIIFNRWGNKIFESNNNFTWDGRTTSGEPCSSGTYYYIIQTETYKGFLELIR